MSRKMFAAGGILLAALIISAVVSMAIYGIVEFARDMGPEVVGQEEVVAAAPVPVAKVVRVDEAVEERLGDVRPYVFQVGDRTCVSYQGALECFCPCETEECGETQDFGYGEYSITLPDESGEEPVDEYDLPERPDYDDDGGDGDDDGGDTPHPPTDPDGDDDQDDGDNPDDEPDHGGDDGDDGEGDQDDGDNDNDGDDDKDGPNHKQHCNQGGGNGSEGCDPGNSNHNQESNDENGSNRGGGKGKGGDKPPKDKD